MNKRVKEYNEKFGDVPCDLNERLVYLIHKYNISMKDLDKIKKEIHRIKKIKYTTLNFIFYFFPDPAPRPRTSRFTKHFYVKDAFNYNLAFKTFIENMTDIDFKINTPCEFYVSTFKPIPESLSKTDIILSELGFNHDISRPDWDNLGKRYSDMVQGHLLTEDSTIYDGRSHKAYSAKPRIEISIKFMNEFDTKYNERKVSKWKVNK